MKFIDSSVRIRHACPFCDFSAKYPQAEMTLWCNGSSEVLQISVSEPSQLPGILEAARETLNAYDVIEDGASALTVTRECMCRKYRSVTVVADECGVWLLPPSVYHGGWETHRVLSSCNAAIQRFVVELRKSGEAEVASKKPRDDLDVIQNLSGVPVHFFDGLTDRQVHMLVVAYESGLLEIPARMKMDTVAGKEGVSRSTYGEHLRKAQLQLLRNSYPFLKLRDAPRNGR